MTDDDRSGWPVVPGYELHEVLGRGGFATVYRATQTSVDRPVALKVLAAAALDPTTERRFRHEVRAVGALSDHPHVVAMIDAGTTTTGAPFISMQLVSAGSLGDRIRAFGPMAPGEVARVGAEVADALEAAHEAGILHRDIKPDNVLVGRRGRALLTDFGIATIDDGTMTATGAITGTLAYTAPEVIKGERPSPASDVFALGATLYALAAGRAAFATGDDHVAAVMWRVTTEDAPPLPPEVPFALADLIGACMAKEPGERPTLPEVATALEAIAARNPPPVVSAAVADEPDTVDVDVDVSDRVDLTDDDATVAVAPSDDAATVAAAPVPGPGPVAPTEVAPAPPPAARRSEPSFPTRKHIAVLVLIPLSLLVAVILAVTLGGDDETAGEPLVIDVGATPVAISLRSDGSAWVADRDDSTVTRISADGEVLGSTPVGTSPSAIAATDRSVWVVNTGDSSLTQLDPDGEEVVTYNVGEASSAVAATEDDVWVASPGDDDIARIDPETALYDDEAPTNVDYESAHLAIGEDAVWAALTLSDGAGVLVQVSPTDFAIASRIALGGPPSGVAVTDGAVWVALGAQGTVVRIDPDTGGIVATIEMGTTEVGDVVADGDDVWVADLAEDRVVQIDTGADEAGTAVAVGAQPDAIAVADGTLWAVTTSPGSLRRISL